MADVKWIKIVTDVFDDEKILLIESLPEADSIIVIWFKLLCLAGKQNNSGVFMMNSRIHYTDEMFATIFRRNINTVRLALSTFENFGMIEKVNEAVTIPNWSKHQNFDQIEKKNEYQREYMREYRAKQKLLASSEDKNSHKTNSKSNGKDNVSALDKNREDKNRVDKSKDIVPGADDSAHVPDEIPIVIKLPLVDKTEYSIIQNQADDWSELYPAVNVIQELRKMRGWLDANPKKQKTKGGIKRFITNWLAREQDKGCRGGSYSDYQSQKNKAAGSQPLEYDSSFNPEDSL